MAHLRNPNPQDNPLAKAVNFNTIINQLKLDPSESFTVSGPTFSAHPNAEANGLATIINVNTQGTIKAINIKPNRFLYVIYLPQWNESNTMWIVPARYDSGYVNGIRDFTESSQLDGAFTSSDPSTWRGSAKSWITSVLNFQGSATGPVTNLLLKKDINFTAYGVDTNRADVSKQVTWTLQTIINQT